MRNIRVGAVRMKMARVWLEHPWLLGSRGEVGVSHVESPGVVATHLRGEGGGRQSVTCIYSAVH